MPGFIDVSNMTDEEIRRLDQCDGYEVVNTPGFNKFYKQQTKVKFSYQADMVWAAAVVAFRINNGYVKALAPGVSAYKTNRQIVEQLLQDNMPLSTGDIEQGKKIRQYFKSLTFKVIEGKTLSTFLTNAMQIASTDNIIDNFSLGVVTSLPATYNIMTERDNVERKIKWARGGFVGNVGDKVTTKIEIIKELWSSNYNTYYYTGINGQDQVLFFAYRKVLEIGTYVTIEGKVKRQCDNSTQLSHVKVI